MNVEELDEDARVRALDDLGVLDTGPEERFDRVTRLAKRLFDVEAAAVTLIDREDHHVKACAGLPLLGMPRAEAFCDTTIRQPDVLVIEDASQDERFAHTPPVAAAGMRFYAGVPLAASGGHRVGALCLLDRRPRRFDDRERDMLAELARWTENELTRSTELRHAAEVQRGLLPRRRPQLPGYDLAWMCVPSRGVGGDFVDWYRTSAGGLAFTLGDVMGKGMAAALVMAIVRTAMRASGQSHPPREAVREAARSLQDDLDETATLVTLCHAELRPEDGAVSFVDAGHGLILVARADGSHRRLLGGGLPLGVVPDTEWDQQAVTLGPGDTLVIVSDGLLDLYDGAVDEVLEVVATAVRGAADLGDALRGLVSRTGQDELVDDVTLVAVRRVG